MMKDKFILKTLITYFLIVLPIFSQIRIQELPGAGLFDGVNNSAESTRRVVPINNGWFLTTELNSAEGIDVNLPFNFEGEDFVVLTRELPESAFDPEFPNVELYIPSVVHSADILFNDVVISKHPGGEFPVRVNLDSTNLFVPGPKKLTIVLRNELDAISTIPVNQRFLFPQNPGGILEGAYLIMKPEVFISDVVVNTNLLNDGKDVNLNLSVKSYGSVEPDSADNGNQDYQIRAGVYYNGTLIIQSSRKKSEVADSSSRHADLTVSLKRPRLWNPESPDIYQIKIELQKDGVTLDSKTINYGIKGIEVKGDKIFLNGKRFNINAVSYVPYSKEYKNLITREEYMQDLNLIKEAGFNTIKFSRKYPSSGFINIAAEMGLFIIPEIELQSVPEKITRLSTFNQRAIQQLKSMVDACRGKFNVLALGLGSGYLGNSSNHADFLNRMQQAVRDNCSKLTFASFISTPGSIVSDVDLAGYETFAQDIAEYAENLNKWKALGKPLIIGEVIYPTFAGSADGYLKEYSQEAQAKYIEDLIELSGEKGISGFIMPPLYDYQGAYHSLFAGFSLEKKLHIGMLGADKNKSRWSYKVVKNSLAEGEAVKIPIGTPANETPIYFILTGLFLSILIALLVNSKRKFREDVMRSFIRPYNFYADIRDQRILTSFHSNILMITLAGSHSLLLTNLLYYLKDNILFERLLLGLGSERIMQGVSYLAWNPLVSLIWLFCGTLVLFFVITVLFKIASQFVRNRVLFVSTYYVVIWAFLPLSILLPVELVLYKILVANIANVAVYIVLTITLLWMAQRMLKGIYVIFDVPGAKVYFYTFLFLLVITGSLLAILHFTEYSTYYVYNVLKQFSII